MKIAYLINQYPKVSHTFIRREIQALESHGAQVARFSVRGSPDALGDPLDQQEQARTRVVLDGGVRGLLEGLSRAALKRPGALARAAALALKVGWKSDAGLPRHLAYLAEACVLMEWMERDMPDHVHAHFGSNPATVAMLLHALGGPPFSFTVHGPEEFDKPGPLSLGEKIRNARFVFGVSSFGRSQLFRQTDLSQWEKIRVLRCGVDQAYLEAEPAPVPDSGRLVCVGRLCEQKGQLLLVEAAGALAREGVDFELVLVGDGEMREEVEAAIARHGLQDKVTITGWASGDAVREYLEGARALVLPSFAEGLPVVIMEALAMGRPVLTTYIAGIPELVGDGECGWLVPAGNKTRLVEAMRRALTTPVEQLTEMGAEGRRRIAALHDIQKNARRLLDTLEGQPTPDGED